MTSRLLRSLLVAAIVLALIWVLGGPLGAVLNAPGLLALEGARRLGISSGSEPTLRGWLWVGTGLSAVFWGLTAFAALAVADRRSGGRA